MAMGPSKRPMSDEHKRTARAVRGVLQMFLREFRHDMPAQYINSFCLVVEDEGRSVTEYAERAGVSKSVMSRHLLDIGDRLRTMETGHGLVTSYVDLLVDARRHVIVLTPKGRALADRMRDFWLQSKGG
jgi:DNA-binding transcriptional ArsR family regulator